MTQLDLRPLTIGEILDRMFTLYRRHFLLFVGITAVPQVLLLAFQVGRLWFFGGPGISGSRLASSFAGTAVLVSLVFALIAYVATLFSQAATILAVSDLYLSRPVTISDCLRRAWGEILTVFGVGFLNGLAILAGLIALVIPGIYIGCRLCVSVPAALIEQRGPQDSISRSWNLTKDHAGRAFVLLLLYFAIAIAGGLLIGIPLGVVTVVYRNNPSALQTWTALSQVGNAVINTLVVPILLIATSVFYFDLRVRKEAFDLQFMMDPTSERTTPPGTGSVPSIL
jgi:Membrane domain of glycerophosphoryl diester phosphodiesterase